MRMKVMTTEGADPEPSWDKEYFLAPKQPVGQRRGTLDQIAERRQGQRLRAFPIGVGCTVRVRGCPRPRLAYE